MEASNLTGIITLVAVVLGVYGALIAAQIAVIGALWLRMGSVQQEFGELKGEVAALREKTNDLEKSIDTLREQMERSHRELKEQMDRNHRELQEQMDRNQSQLLRAIIAHSHRPDGRPTFDLPPDFEPTPADN